MLLQLDSSSDIPLYEQLCHQVMEGILQGKLTAGDPLPSVRSLASDLGVNMHTVNKGYHLLEKKGVIEIIPKSGAIVAHISSENLTTTRRAELVKLLRPPLVESLLSGLSEEEIHQVLQELVQSIKED